MTPVAKSRAPFILASLSLSILGLALVAMTACGGGGSQTSSPTSPVQAAPGTITVNSSAIVGQQGKVLLVFASPKGGGPVARACISITSDRFVVPATAMTDMPAGQDPCGGSTPQTTFPKGTYTLVAGIYAPPAKSPEKESSQTVEISGDTSVKVEIDGASLSR